MTVTLLKCVNIREDTRYWSSSRTVPRTPDRYLFTQSRILPVLVTLYRQLTLETYNASDGSNDLIHDTTTQTKEHTTNSIGGVLVLQNVN
jgi:hypothetical protein